MPITRTEEFNKMLEAQQNLVAGYDAMAQLGTIEELMYQQSDWSGVLRGAVLMSLTNGGIKVKNIEAFKRDFLQVNYHLPGIFRLLSSKVDIIGIWLSLSAPLNISPNPRTSRQIPFKPPTSFPFSPKITQTSSGRYK